MGIVFLCVKFILLYYRDQQRVPPLVHLYIIANQFIHPHIPTIGIYCSISYIRSYSHPCNYPLELMRFCVLKKWVHSRIGQCSRPAVNTITFHSYIRLSSNFVHRIVSSISRSSSKMRRIRQEMAELSKTLSLLTRPPLRMVQGFFQKKIFFAELIKTYIKRLRF